MRRYIPAQETHDVSLVFGGHLLVTLTAGCGSNRTIPGPPLAISGIRSPNRNEHAGRHARCALERSHRLRRRLRRVARHLVRLLAAFVNPSLQKTKIHLVRFPGGSESDAYHWENGGTVCANQGYITPSSTFDRLDEPRRAPLEIDVAITLNYGSNPACNGGGDPNEAAAWAGYARRHGYHVSYWTVGNEVYGSWEYDLHSHPHDPHIYARAVRNGYYPAMKKADPQAQVGIVVDVPSDRAWNGVVLREAQPFDFVELHYYPEYNIDSDSFLLGPAISTFDGDLKGLCRQMAAAAVKKMPIYLGEYNNDAGNEGKQSVSIVNGLFVGQMLGTLKNEGVGRSTFWLAYGSCDENGDYSKKLYGWQHFGTEALFSDDLPAKYSRLRRYAAHPRRNAVSDCARHGSDGERNSRRLEGSQRRCPGVARYHRPGVRLRSRRRLRVRDLQQHALGDRRRCARRRTRTAAATTRRCGRTVKRSTTNRKRTVGWPGVRRA